MRAINKYVVIVVMALLGLSVFSGRANIGEFLLVTFIFIPVAFAWRALSASASKRLVLWAKWINVTFSVVASLSIVAALSFTRGIDIGTGLVGMLPMILVVTLYYLNARALAKQTTVPHEKEA